jgi:hypothetical protein|tara:strand:- start:913 stop:1521 length:609 start_codon:yes stop_codon:yes gene_type:complete
MRSFSEIDTTVKRACKGAGYTWGISEEVGKNIKLLELFGLPGLKNLNLYLKSLNNKKFQNISLISKNNSSSIPYCPIISGVNFIDQIKILEEMKEVTFENVAYPILFLPFVSRSSEIIGKKIKFLMDDNQFLLNYNQSLYSNYLSEKILENVKLIKIQFLDNANTFDENEWNEIYKLSENTFVEENEKLKKSAAGAGLTDND